MLPQPVVQHNCEILDRGSGWQTSAKIGRAKPADAIENAPKDMVTALPGEVTRIKVTFDKPGRYVWHCHILSHEDHEMMRVLHVGPGAANHAARVSAAQDEHTDRADQVTEIPDGVELENNVFIPFVSGQ